MELYTFLDENELKRNLDQGMDLNIGDSITMFDTTFFVTEKIFEATTTNVPLRIKYVLSKWSPEIYLNTTDTFTFTRTDNEELTIEADYQPRIICSPKNKTQEEITEETRNKFISLLE